MAAIPKRECTQCTGRPGLSLAGLEVMRPRRVHEALLNSSRRAALLCSAPASPCSPALQGRAVPSIVQSSCPLFIIYQSLCCCLCLAASAPPHHACLVRSNSFTPAGSPLFWAVVISLPHLERFGAIVSLNLPSQPCSQESSISRRFASSTLDSHPRHAHAHAHGHALTTRRCVPPCIRPGTCRERTMTHPPTPRPANKL